MGSRFRLLRPATVADAVADLDRLGEAARVYAGGAELLLLMRNGVVEPDYLIDIKRIDGLDRLEWDGNVLRIGATVVHRRLERDDTVRRVFPALAEAEAHLGNVRVRAQGTLGGNLCFADPHADPGTALSIHDAMAFVAGPAGGREVQIARFITDTYQTALAPNEILTHIEVSPLPPGWRSKFLRIERYYRPTANVAAAALMHGSTIGEVRMAVGCIGPRPLRLTELEDELRGSTAAEADARLATVGGYLARLLEPVDDLLGSVDYKLHVASVLLRRAVADVADASRASEVGS